MQGQILSLILTTILQIFATPVWGGRATGAPLAGVLAEPGFSLSTGYPGANLAVEVVDDKFDAFQESFNEGTTDFDDDFRDYIDDSFVDTALVLGKTHPGSRLLFESGPAVVEPDVEANSVAVDLEPTLTEFASEVRTPALIHRICGSREFQPTQENWWISGADRWLKEYTAKNKDTKSFKSFGLVGSIVEEYLGHRNFNCKVNVTGGLRQKLCSVSCKEIVEKVGDIEEAKRVLFVLAGVVGLAERVGTVYNALRAVPSAVAHLVDGMPTKGGLNTPADGVTNILFNTVGLALLAASPLTPTKQISQDAYESLQAAKHHYDVAIQVSSFAAKGNDPYKWDKAFDYDYGMSLAEIDLAYKGYAEGTIAVPEGMSEDTWFSKAVLRTSRALEDARKLVVEVESGGFVEARNGGFELFKRLFKFGSENQKRILHEDSRVDVKSTLDIAAGRARDMLADALAGLLGGDSSSVDGTTDLSRLLRYGHYSPAGSRESITNFKKVNTIGIISRNIFMELFNNSIRQQHVYISCTEDKKRRANPRNDLSGARADSCYGDNTGPQNLKACFDGMVCYLYEWNERSMSHMSRNKAPKGNENWDEKPWGIEPQDIILSSVAHHFRKGFSPKDIAEEADFYAQTTTLDTLSSARSAGRFNIPVCMSAHNWNTRLDGWNTFCDTSRHCTAKNLPCHCGASGRDTLALWEDIGISESPQRDFYSATLCPRQIQKKISDPLERYVAYCNLGIKRRGSGGSRVDGARRYQGRDKYCDVIVEAVKRQAHGLVNELPLEMKFMFRCQIQNGGRGCKMYEKSFGILWEEAQKGTEEAV